MGQAMGGSAVPTPGVQISARTKAALVAAKARGTVVLGGFRGFMPGEAARAAAAAAKAKAAEGRADRLRDVVGVIRASGITSAAGLAKELKSAASQQRRAASGRRCRLSGSWRAWGN